MAYARTKEEKWVVVVIPFCEELLQNKEAISIELPSDAPQQWINLLTNETIDFADEISLLSSLQKFPVAILTAGL